MYHRFNENKYPSTNIKNEIFLEHLNEINKENNKFRVHVLQGTTSSGKTIVYFAALKAIINKGFNTQ